MAALSNYLANKVLDHIRGVASYTMPNAWVALCTTTPTATVAGTEATYTGYARAPAQVTATTTALSSASTTLTVPTTGIAVGTVVSGAGISGSPTVVSITDGTHLVVSAAQTVSNAVPLTFNWFTAAASGSGTTGAILTYAACTAGTSTVTAFQLYDALTAGNPLEFGACSLSVSSGITPQWAAGALTTTLT